MAITPNGSPSWVRNASHETYGGHTDKTNYQAQGVVNPRTDVGAEAIVRMAADLAAATRTMPFAVLTFVGRDSTTDHPNVEFCSLQTGLQITTYVGDSPPSGFPTVTRSSDGVHVITFATSYLDEYGVSGSFAPTMALPGPAGATGFDVSSVVSGQTVTVYSTSGGSPIQDKRVTVEVW